LKECQSLISTSYKDTLKNVTKNINKDGLSSHVDMSSNSSSKQEITVVAKPVTVTINKLHRYAICSSYWEQQTNAILNMFSMQRWANSLGMTVVEPFVCHSKLEFPKEMLYNDTLVNTLRLCDYIDLDYWNTKASKSGVPPLEKWENFVIHSTKSIIVVIMPYSDGPGGTYINNEIEEQSNCKKAMSDFFYMHVKLFHSLQFEAVRNVCISFFNYIIPPETFNAAIQIENEKDITIWLTEWRGVDNGRVSFTGLGHNVFGRTYDGEAKLLQMINPSARILNDSQRYVSMVLGVDFYQYNAVVVRHKPPGQHTFEWNIQHFNNCASLLEKQISSVKNCKVFLAIDIGKFGDKLRTEKFDYSHDSYHRYIGYATYFFKRYLSIIYGNKTIDSYYDDFIRVTNGNMDSGYIGALQKTIAMYAKQVVLVGGHSSFQNTIIQHFVKQHNIDAITKLCY